MGYEIIKTLAKEKGIPLEKIAKDVGITYNSLSKIIRNTVSEPKFTTMAAIAHIFGMSVDQLAVEAGLSTNTKTDKDFNADEQRLVQKYRPLDTHGKEAVNAVLDVEYARYERLNQKQPPKEAPNSRPAPESEVNDCIIMKIYNQKASAGLGNYLYSDSNHDYEMLEFPASEIPRHADFGIRISGDSMEPTIENGSIVWVESVPAVDNGEIGIFIYEDEAYCKELRVNHSDREIVLISHNEDYNDIVIREPYGLITVGRVLL